MRSDTLKSKYRLLVLFNHSKSSLTALRTAVNLAKTVDGGIEVFYVKPPNEVVRYENQIAVMRALDEERIKAKQTMQRLINTIAETEGVPIIYNFTFGNVVHEIQDHIAKTNPDLVVLGKRKRKIVNFLGDRLTAQLLKKHKGGILISGSENKPQTFSNVSLGFLDDASIQNDIEITEDLKERTSKPLRLFRINKNEQPLQMNPTTKTITFEFDGDLDLENSVSKYIEKNEIGLLCVHREMNSRLNNSITSVNNQIKKTISKTRVPVLILAQ